MRAVTFSRKVAGKAFHTSCDSTSEPRGRLAFRKHAKILASSAGVVLRLPGCRPRTFRARWKFRTTHRIVLAGVRGCWISLAISLKGCGFAPDFARAPVEIAECLLGRPHVLRHRWPGCAGRARPTANAAKA